MHWTLLKNVLIKSSVDVASGMQRFFGAVHVNQCFALKNGVDSGKGEGGGHFIK